MSKKFSIVCLTYKRIDMLEEAIYSVLQQTYKDIELLVINDCNLHKLSYSHPDINIINLDTKFKTLGEKRNFGLKNVNGEYVMYLDDDDLLLPNYIENINNKIGNNDWLSAQKVILYNENSLDIKPSHWLIPNPIFRKSISENVYYDDINYDELTPFYKKIISKGSGLFSLLKDENIGYVYRQNIPSSYSMFNLRYKSVDEQNELLNSIEYKTGDIELHPHWNKDYVDIIKTNIKYQPKPLMKTVLNNTGSDNTIIMANNWTKVKKSWEKAESFLGSMTSRGIISTALDVLNIDKFAGEKVSDEIYNLRRDSCFGNDGRSIKQCDQLKYNNSLESFCGSCGCGQTKLAKLDGEGYTKLHYPYLECPLKKEGFSNHEIPLSVIIPVLNDNEELNLTIESLYNTSPSSIDVIVIDDASTVPVVVNDKRVRFYRFEERRGAGQARHFGAEQAKSKHLLFIDSHMRFDENWYENAMKRIINTPKTLWCGVCLGLSEGNMDIKKANGCYTGADLVLYAEKNKTIFDGVWSPGNPDSDDYEISCVMGACYFIHKDWFFHIKGLGQTMMWGSEEPILSVKSWFAGGEVRIMKSVKLGHKFRNQSPYATNISHINYNKLAYMYMLFPTELYEFLKGKFNNDGNLMGAIELVERNKTALDEEREYYKSIFVRDIKWLCNKFNITIDLETEKEMPKIENAVVIKNDPDLRPPTISSGKILLKTHSFLGDCICSEPTIRELCKKHKNVYVITQYPDLFLNYDCPINIISESEESKHEWAIVYRLISDGNDSLVKGVSKLVGVHLENFIPKLNLLNSPHSLDKLPDNYIAISCESTDNGRVWNVDKWENLCIYFHNLGYKILQIGKWGEPLKNVDRFIKNSSFVDVAHAIKHSKYFITVDSGLSHLAASIQKQYIVLMHNVPIQFRTHESYTIPVINQKGLSYITENDVIDIINPEKSSSIIETNEVDTTNFKNLNRLKIIKAQYDKLDVTNILNRRITNDKLIIKVNNDNFTDPNFNVYKKLSVEYEYNNEIKKTVVYENQDLILPENVNQKNILLLTSCNRIKQVILALTINSYIIKKPFSVIIADCSSFGLSFDEANKLDHSGTILSDKTYCSDITLFDKYINLIPNIKEYKLLHVSPKMNKQMGESTLIALGLAQSALLGDDNIRNDFCLKLTGVCILRYDLLSQIPILLENHDILTFEWRCGQNNVSTRVFGCRSKPILQLLINSGWDKWISQYTHTETKLSLLINDFIPNRINHHNDYPLNESGILLDGGSVINNTRKTITEFIQDNNIPTDLPIIQEFLNGDIYD